MPDRRLAARSSDPRGHNNDTQPAPTETYSLQNDWMELGGPITRPPLSHFVVEAGGCLTSAERSRPLTTSRPGPPRLPRRRSSGPATSGVALGTSGPRSTKTPVVRAGSARARTPRARQRDPAVPLPVDAWHARPLAARGDPQAYSGSWATPCGTTVAPKTRPMPTSPARDGGMYVLPPLAPQDSRSGRAR